MIASAELNRDDSCINRALDREFVFVLLARDAAAPRVIRAWAMLRLEMGLNTAEDETILEALRCADAMEAQRHSVRVELGKEKQIGWGDGR